MRISIIAAAASNRVIGRDNEMPWRIPADLKYFRQVTMGKPIVMGRKTFAAIGKPLDGRTNIVISRDPAFKAPGATLVGDIETALAAGRDAAEAAGVDEVMVIGGAQIYAAVLPAADRIYLTELHREAAGDAFFPIVDRAAWRETSREDRDEGGERFSFVILDRIGPKEAVR